MDFKYIDFIRSRDKVKYVKAHKPKENDWVMISKYPKLSIIFMKTFKKQLDWDQISWQDLIDNSGKEFEIQN